MTGTHDSRPVLDTIRALLRFKDHTTISEIASTSGLKRRHVLDVLNRNGPMVFRCRDNGRITKVDTAAPLRKQLWESGEFYRPGTYGAWSVEGHCLEFSGHEDLRSELARRRTIGGLGDSSTIRIVEDTPENRAALESAGMRPWDEAVIDDRLWEEAPRQV